MICLQLFHILFAGFLSKNLRRMLFFECKQRFLVDSSNNFFFPVKLNQIMVVDMECHPHGGIIKLRQSTRRLCGASPSWRFCAVTSIIVMMVMFVFFIVVGVVCRAQHSPSVDGDVHALHRGGRVRSHTRHRDDGDVRVPLQPLLLPLQAFQVQD